MILSSRLLDHDYVSLPLNSFKPCAVAVVGAPMTTLLCVMISDFVLRIKLNIFAKPLIPKILIFYNKTKYIFCPTYMMCCLKKITGHDCHQPTEIYVGMSMR